MIILKKNISFSPPDITMEDIDAVISVLKSGWITSGPKVKEFEENLKNYCETDEAVTVSSATSSMELILKVFNIGKDDEVITTPYTYTATSSVLLHREIKPIFVDLQEGTFSMDYKKLKQQITENTKAIMPVDFAGFPCEYDKIKAILKEKDREDILIIVDSAHSFGAKYKGKIIGSQCDFHSFSFHAVKNLTTSEGGALVYNDKWKFKYDDLYKIFKITSLHGQTKDAFSKINSHSWEYDIVTDGFKCNMTDISAALGISQLKRYSDILCKRKNICFKYESLLKEKEWAILPQLKTADGTESSYHLYPLRIKQFDENQRNTLIKFLNEEGISTNVHFKPLPMLTLYKNLGYNINDFPNAYNQYKNEISLPVHTKLSFEDVEFLVAKLIYYIEEIKHKNKY